MIDSKKNHLFLSTSHVLAEIRETSATSNRPYISNRFSMVQLNGRLIYMSILVHSTLWTQSVVVIVDVAACLLCASLFFLFPICRYSFLFFVPSLQSSHISNRKKTLCKFCFRFYFVCESFNKALTLK